MIARTLLVALGLMVAASPLAAAGVATPGTPAGMACANVDSDSCVASGYVSTTGTYALGISGAFVGSVTATLTNGLVTRTMTCTNVVGLVSSGCALAGPFPGPGLPLTLTCDSAGTGVAVCFVNGA